MRWGRWWVWLVGGAIEVGVAHKVGQVVGLVSGWG